MPYRLAETLADVEAYLAGLEADRPFGMDTEGTSLNTRKSKLVGISLSTEEADAIYIPTGHKIGNNLPQAKVIELIKDRIELTGAKPIFHNAKIDLSVLQRNTGWYPKEFGDSIEALYLNNPDRKRKGLKIVAKEDFGVDMERFENLFTPEEIKAGVLDISTKSPKRCVDYASADADLCLRIWRKYEGDVEQFAFASKVDHKLIDIVRKIEHNGGLELNEPYIKAQMEILEGRAAALRETIHRMAGEAFEINSPKKLGIILFDKLGMPSQGMTRGRNPQYITNEEALDRLRKDYPIVELIICYKKVVKAHSSYFKKLDRLIDRGIKPRFAFNMFSAPTWRFAAPGGDPDKDGMCGVNIQAVSNGEARDISGVALVEDESIDSGVFDLDPDELLTGEITTDQADDGDPNLDPTELPWTVPNEEEGHTCFRESCSGCPAACALRNIDTTRRLQKNVMMVPSVRQAFKAPDGYVLLSFDYDSQELVIGANLSGEPKWLEALKRGEDLHERTASIAFGQSLDEFRRLPKGEYSRKRKIGKTLNFAGFYGATARTLAAKSGMPQRQAEVLFDNHVNGHPVLFSWIRKCHAFSRKHGYTTSYFGRRRWLKDFYSMGRRYERFADRSSVNTCIQGTAAEVTRIAMVRCAKAIQDSGYSSQNLRFVMQIHDELMFRVHQSLVDDAIPLLKKAMEFQVKSWDVQLTVSPKVGTVWGQQKELKLAA